MFKRKHPQRVEPGPGQESVWDYPRPPALEPSKRRVRVVFNGETIIDSTNAYRILETSHPPTYYIPQADAKLEYFHPVERRTFCEFKGRAAYWTITVGDKSAPEAAWQYPDAGGKFAPVAGYIALYPAQMDACYLDDEQVQAQEGDYYGGWITSDIVGPFKGGSGTWGW